ncbi:tumor necrosis factor ligand superfamily member 6 [Loxodonta africana]|uniref:Tumor necrosis factor ligand superfamily member 6 n=1 Tax=Loxodonta africana TaxID=9785 RepID=G3TAL3_LOXAF|nr:tumor necrosis factor ligand superfamily member 6 [Loxodonta africana]XP_049731995.1 tumor necrosis factor ligand superfamily member 6 [Elephas maximus indicus]CTQ86276.1 TPA: tumor necrosis factor ligand 1A [Loxodonta africana]
MWQPLNYPYPQIYWVDSSSSSPLAPPGSALPCPSSVPGRPGQMRPPPPPPPPLPPRPPLPPFPPSLLKKRRNPNTGLYLLVMFFMVLVALVGLGLGLFQLFHLQKELAELRESTRLSPVASSLEKQIGQPSLPSEKREVKKVAHLTGNPNSRSIPLEWEDTYGIALVSGVKYKKGGLVINDTGLYFVYSKVYFRGHSCNNQPLNHKVYMRNSKYPQDLVLMEERMMNYCTTGQMWARSSYLGAVFNLTIADNLYVNVSELSLVNFEESKTFFGLYKL